MTSTVLKVIRNKANIQDDFQSEGVILVYDYLFEEQVIRKK